MSRYIIDGGKRLSGEVNVQGSKNATLPILAAALLVPDEVVLLNCPRLSDVEASIRILRYLGCKAVLEDNTLVVDSRSMTGYAVPSELMHRMRSSIVFLGAVTARAKRAKMSFPGGCELGPRPIDLHLSALRKMGVEIDEEHGELSCRAYDGVKAAKLTLAFPSVGATENIMLAAATAEGTTILTNAAREPEIEDLADFLNACGAKISGAGEGTLIIEGVERLHGTVHAVIPDRIAAATLMSAAAVTHSSITLKGVIEHHLSAVIPVFEESGCEIAFSGGEMRFSAPYRLKSPKLIRTMPYPGFPTDAQAPVMAMTAVCDGMTVFVENMFESRFKHVSELCRLGANIKVEGRVAVVDGVRRLSSANVRACDLRGAASLVCAALAASGKSEVDGICYLERGYEDFERVLCSLGADVKKI